MSAEVHIVCDVCKKSIYRGDSPSYARALADSSSQGEMTIEPMHAYPPPSVTHGRVSLTESQRQQVFEKQVCGRECARVAALEALDVALADAKGFNSHSLDISLTMKKP
jgi:hypothetical protein